MAGKERDPAFRLKTLETALKTRIDQVAQLQRRNAELEKSLQDAKKEIVDLRRRCLDRDPPRTWRKMPRQYG